MAMLNNQWVNNRQPISQSGGSVIRFPSRIDWLQVWLHGGGTLEILPRTHHELRMTLSALEVWTQISVDIKSPQKDSTDCHAFLAQNIAIAINEWPWMHESPNRWLQTTLWHALKKTCGRHNTAALVWRHECWRSQQTKVYNYSHERANVGTVAKPTPMSSMPWESSQVHLNSPTYGILTNNANDTIPMRSVTTSEQSSWSCPTILKQSTGISSPQCGFDWPNW